VFKIGISHAAVEAAFGKEPLENEALEEEEALEEDGQNKSSLSRGQRKRMKRRNAFMKKMGLVNRVVQEKKKEEKIKENGMFADLEELQKSLFAAEKNQIKEENNLPTGPKKNLTGKQRQKLAIRELSQLKAVHTHPSFQGNPFAAIQMHLQNTVVQANEASIQKTNEINKPKENKNNKNNHQKMETEE
jgi:hypothetical protein